MFILSCLYYYLYYYTIIHIVLNVYHHIHPNDVKRISYYVLYKNNIKIIIIITLS